MPISIAIFRETCKVFQAVGISFEPMKQFFKK